MKRLRTPLRYPGGKARALKRIMKVIPESFSEYREPMVGGGSVFLRINQYKNKNLKIKISDLNYDLYCFWKIIKYYPKLFINDVTEIKNNEKNGKELFISYREQQNNITDYFRGIRFYVLNRISFSGTVDTGGYSQESFQKRFTLSKIQEINHVNNYLKNVEIRYGSYENLLFEKGDDIFIYLDPPYYNAHALYGKKGNLTKMFDHYRFNKDVNKCKHNWLITYDDNEYIRKLYKNNYIYEWELKYGMSSHNGKNLKVGKEIFISKREIDYDRIIYSSNINNKKIDFVLNPIEI